MLKNLNEVLAFGESIGMGSEFYEIDGWNYLDLRCNIKQLMDFVSFIHQIEGWEPSNWEEAIDTFERIASIIGSDFVSPHPYVNEATYIGSRPNVARTMYEVWQMMYLPAPHLKECILHR